MAQRKFTEEEAKERKNARQRDYNKRTGKSADYNKERGTSVAFRLFAPQDNDVLEKLNSVGNKAGYIKSLIREDIAKSKSEQNE